MHTEPIPPLDPEEPSAATTGGAVQAEAPGGTAAREASLSQLPARNVTVGRRATTELVVSSSYIGRLRAQLGIG